MTDRGYDLEECLEAIDPASLDYAGWCSVGMALHAEGYPASVWDAWSRRDPARYHAGECEAKYRSFDADRSDGVGGGTVVQMARDAGWRPSSDAGSALGWDDDAAYDGEAPKRPGQVVDPTWVEADEMSEPGDAWEGWRDLVAYLDALFEPGEVVGYVTGAWEKDGRWLPDGKGPHTETAEEITRRIVRCGGRLDEAIGWSNGDAGAWIRFNPLDGRGVRNENVAEYRYALVESDEIPVGKQLAIVRELNLPCAAIVHSGNKSLHAIVRIDAADYGEYRKRVDQLYAACRKNGLPVDTQNKNPSRLSRMPGVTRGGRKQWLVATNAGAASWAEWREWLAEQEDDLPEPESLAGVWDAMPDLAPPLVDGVLRQGHKMLLAGPSKAGKSFLLIELCVAVAEGLPWIGFPCAQGRVLYVNLELDRASCLHRFRDVYAALGVEPRNAGSIEVWNLRGRSKPMDALAPSLIRRALKTRPIMVVIDPIYKVITGDENSASEMAAFCNQFDRIATEIGCAVAYCHHHSKGMQGQKRSMDRASGSGVFARDPDAMLDMIELPIDDAMRGQQENDEVCRGLAAWMDAWCANRPDKGGDGGWRAFVPPDDQVVAEKLIDRCRGLVSPSGCEAEMLSAVYAARQRAKARTAWRVEGTLREFARFEPRNLWFDYPSHAIDESGVLADVAAEGSVEERMRRGSKRGADERKRKAKADREERVEAMRAAMAACRSDGVEPTRAAVLERIGEVGGREVTADMLRNWTSAKSGWSPVRVDPERAKEGVLTDADEEAIMSGW